MRSRRPATSCPRRPPSARSESTRAACGALLEAFRGVGRLRVAAGFRRQVAAASRRASRSPATCSTPRIEAARLSRQVTRMDVPGSRELGPAEFHQLDLEAWPELIDLCFTYRDGDARALRRSGRSGRRRPSTMYASPPGRPLVFHRYKRSHVARAGATLSLYQSMFDQVHGFELWYDVDQESHEMPRGPGADSRACPTRHLRRAAGARVEDLVGVTARRRLGGRRAGRGSAGGAAASS